MFYSELLSSPINSYNVKRRYGIDPDKDLARALASGIYPVTEAPEGYTPTHYIKRGTRYVAIPHEFSDAERHSIHRIQAYALNLEEAAEKLKGDAPVTADLPAEEATVKKRRAKPKK